MTRVTANEIRQQFVDYFVQKRGHTFVASSPCVPVDDPTLMFTNAGMNQFKDVFLATGTRPYARAANTQKCIRAGGKHNDLDDVGHDTYHHTFFEMLGNWSFGDYFKKEAITWAWDLLTNVWGLDKTRLHATYFQGDPAEGLEPDLEAAELWKTATDIDPAHIHPGDKKDNFWEMGDVGPCGPCSEIHIDLTPDKSGAPLVNAGDARVIEIWNLVFIQFDRAPGGKLSPLPAKHVDTGMGLERLCAVIQGVDGNYETDIFAPIFAAIYDVTGAPEYTGLLESDLENASATDSEQAAAPRAQRAGVSDTNQAEAPHAQRAGVSPRRSPRAEDRPAREDVMRDVTYRVIADHLRCLTFALTDGAMPDNEGRGFVLRRILRRAVRYGRQYLEIHEPFLCKLIPTVVESMSGAFPELKKDPKRIAEIIRDEEESFGRTLDRGIGLFEQWADLTRRIAEGDYVTEEHPTDAPTAQLRDTGKWIHPKEVQIFRDAGAHVIPGAAAFKLHDTYGFPIDLTELMAVERGLTVNIGEYERLMDEAREQARAGIETEVNKYAEMEREAAEDTRRATDDRRKYADEHRCASFFTSFARQSARGDTDSAKAGETIPFTVAQTCFYAEAGGQVSDIGTVVTDTGKMEVLRVSKRTVMPDGEGQPFEVVVHLGKVVKGEIWPGSECELRLSPKRIATMKNHTATHIMNWALREVLGDRVQQKGSLVDPEKTRFDLSHHAAITNEELTRIEELVNRMIADDLPVHAREVELAAAKKINTLRAVFGEKYPEKVRVISIGKPVEALIAEPENPEWMKYSVEFCGGTHLKHTGEAGRFRLIEESAVAKGIRRVTGITGKRAEQAEAAVVDLSRQLKDAAKADDADLPQRITELMAAMHEAELPVVERNRLRGELAGLQDRAKRIQKQAAKVGAADVMAKADDLLAGAERIGGTAIIVAQMGEAPVDQLRQACDSLRARAESAAILLAAEQAGKVILLAAMTHDLAGKGVKAGDLIKAIAPTVGGKGGGRPDMAQGGGPDLARVPDAVREAGEWLRAKLGG